MLNFTPDPIAITLGPIPVYWYGIGYALGLAVAYLVMVRLAQRAGEDPELLGNGMIVVAIAALIGGRAYHVIDQWSNLYASDPIKIFLPPYSGLGVYGGIVTGTIAAYLYARRVHAPFLRWADIVAPGLFVMQGIARWGNFFNQELYGPPTTQPWGIPIDCAHRLQDLYPCTLYPPGTLFQPLFLYESIAGILGAVVLIVLGFRARKWLRPGDLLLLFFVWYGAVRFALETLRHDNWTFFSIPVAQIVSVLIVVPAVVLLIWRHRAGNAMDDPPSRPEAATWGAVGRLVEPDDDDGDLDDEGDEDDFDDDFDDDDDHEHDEDDGAEDAEEDGTREDGDADAEHVRDFEDEALGAERLGDEPSTEPHLGSGPAPRVDPPPGPTPAAG